MDFTFESRKCYRLIEYFYFRSALARFANMDEYLVGIWNRRWTILLAICVVSPGLMPIACATGAYLEIFGS